MSRLLFVLIWSTLSMAFAVLAWAIWSLIWPFQPIDIHSITVDIDARVKRGEPIWTTIDYCKRSTLTATMDTSIEQAGRVMLIAPQRPVFEPGCHKVRLPLVTVPAIMAIESTTAAGDGRAYIEARLSYRINALRTINYTFRTGPFLIDP